MLTRRAPESLHAPESVSACPSVGEDPQKCSKHKLNHELQASAFTAKFDVISIIDRSTDHGKLLSICVFIQ